MSALRRPFAAVVVVAAALAVAACSRSNTEPDPAQSARLDALPRALSTGEQGVISAANGFSFALFRRLSAAQPGENVFVSPLSASMALGMAMNGAAGATRDEMRSTLGFPSSASETEIGESYQSLIALLRGLDPGVEFRIANSIWYRPGFPVTQRFLDEGRTWFDAQASAIDFDGPGALPAINGWVSTATAGKIPTILEAIQPDEVMFLINAIYFKGSWRERFDPARTIDAPFHAPGGDQPAKLMYREGTMRLLETPQFDAVDLPYGNGAYSMTVVLPRAGTSVDAVAASLEGPAWSTWTAQFRDALVDLHLPRFRLTWERKLIPDLDALGMHAAFDPSTADFSRLTPGGGVYISVVKQKTYVDVNEEGTEAAAVTNVGISTVSAPARTPVRVDRPFIVVIRERLSGTVLFMGKIARLP